MSLFRKMIFSVISLKIEKNDFFPKIKNISKNLVFLFIRCIFVENSKIIILCKKSLTAL